MAKFELIKAYVITALSVILLVGIITLSLIIHNTLQKSPDNIVSTPIPKLTNDETTGKNAEMMNPDNLSGNLAARCTKKYFKKMCHSFELNKFNSTQHYGRIELVAEEQGFPLSVCEPEFDKMKNSILHQMDNMSKSIQTYFHAIDKDNKNINITLTASLNDTIIMKTFVTMFKTLQEFRVPVTNFILTSKETKDDNEVFYKSGIFTGLIRHYFERSDFPHSVNYFIFHVLQEQYQNSTQCEPISIVNEMNLQNNSEIGDSPTKKPSNPSTQPVTS